MNASSNDDSKTVRPTEIISFPIQEAMAKYRFITNRHRNQISYFQIKSRKALIDCLEGQGKVAGKFRIEENIKEVSLFLKGKRQSLFALFI